MPMLPLRIRHDGLLSLVAPIGAALAVGTCVVVDLAPDQPPLPGERTVADLVDDGPTAEDLTPRRGRIGVLPSGGAEPADAAEVVAALGRTWPFVVLRVTESDAVDVAPLFGPPTSAWVHQPTGLVPVPPSLPGVVLPTLRPATVRSVLAGRHARGRWVSSWQRVWRSL